MNKEEFKKYVNEVNKNIENLLKDNEEELNFYQLLVNTFNQVCEERNNLEQALDNGKDTSLRDQIKQFCRSYLIEKENIIDLSSLMKTLKYDKKNSLRERVIISKEKNLK